MNFLILEGDFPFWRNFLVEEWKRLPVRTLLLSQVPKLWRRQDYDALETLPLSGPDIDAAALRRLVDSFGPVSGALTVFEPAVGRALEAQRLLGLPRITALEARAVRNKAGMVETMKAAGLDAPRTAFGTDAATVVQAALAELAFPMITKPSELAGKAGVKLVEKPEDLCPAVDAALAETLPFEIDGAMTSVVEAFACERSVLVQEYIEGPEFSVEGYAARGEITVLAVTEKLNSGPPLFEELGHLQPARIDELQQRTIEDYVVAAGRAFKLENTFFHFELRLAERGPVMMEINCRLGGDMIARLLELRSGMNVGETLMRLAAGEAVPRPRFVGAAGVRMATVGRGGTLASLHAPMLRSDREFAVFEPAIGSPIHAPKPGGATRVGYFIVAAADAGEVETRLAELAAETRIDVA